MSIAEITVVSVALIVQVILLAVAYRIGKQNGYWKRVGEEKFARGIR